jgi:hypothetical protein
MSRIAHSPGSTDYNARDVDLLVECDMRKEGKERGKVNRKNNAGLNV